MRTDAPASTKRPQHRMWACVVCTLLTVAVFGGAAAHEPVASSATPRPLDPKTQPVVAVVDAFSSAIKSGDLARAGDLLSPDALILESGNAERSREAYPAGHAAHDAEFLKNADSVMTQRTAQLAGNMAWVGTQSELHATDNGKAVVLLATETMVLQRMQDGWRIVHIHWSSRPERAS